jgi:hypothetical protein
VCVVVFVCVCVCVCVCVVVFVCVCVCVCVQNGFAFNFPACIHSVDKMGNSHPECMKTMNIYEDKFCKSKTSNPCLQDPC